MRTMSICITVVLGFALAANPAGAAILFDDGLTHEISTRVGHIEIYDSLSGEPTVVELVARGYISDVDVYQNSRFFMSAGILGGSLALHDYSSAEISGGIVDEDPFYLTDFSQLTITGGYVEEALRIHEDSQVFIHGSNFQVDGLPVDYGPLAATTGYLRGDLLDGQIGCGLSINDTAAITLVPEPATLALLSLGSLGLLRHRSRRSAEAGLAAARRKV